MVESGRLARKQLEGAPNQKQNDQIKGTNKYRLVSNKPPSRHIDLSRKKEHQISANKRVFQKPFTKTLPQPPKPNIPRKRHIPNCQPKYRPDQSRFKCVSPKSVKEKKEENKGADENVPITFEHLIESGCNDHVYDLGGTFNARDIRDAGIDNNSNDSGENIFSIKTLTEVVNQESEIPNAVLDCVINKKDVNDHSQQNECLITSTASSELKRRESTIKVEDLEKGITKSDEEVLTTEIRNNEDCDDDIEKDEVKVTERTKDKTSNCNQDELTQNESVTHINKTLLEIPVNVTANEKIDTIQEKEECKKFDKASKYSRDRSYSESRTDGSWTEGSCEESYTDDESYTDSSWTEESYTDNSSYTDDKESYTDTDRSDSYSDEHEYESTLSSGNEKSKVGGLSRRRRRGTRRKRTKDTPSKCESDLKNKEPEKSETEPDLNPTKLLEDSYNIQEKVESISPNIEAKPLDSECKSPDIEQSKSPGIEQSKSPGIEQSKSINPEKKLPFIPYERPPRFNSRQYKTTKLYNWRTNKVEVIRHGKGQQKDKVKDACSNKPGSPVKRTIPIASPLNQIKKQSLATTNSKVTVPTKTNPVVSTTKTTKTLSPQNPKSTTKQNDVKHQLHNDPAKITVEDVSSRITQNMKDMAKELERLNEEIRESLVCVPKVAENTKSPSEKVKNNDIIHNDSVADKEKNSNKENEKLEDGHVTGNDVVADKGKDSIKENKKLKDGHVADNDVAADKEKDLNKENKKLEDGHVTDNNVAADKEKDLNKENEKLNEVDSNDKQMKLKKEDKKEEKVIDISETTAVVNLVSEKTKQTLSRMDRIRMALENPVRPPRTQNGAANTVLIANAAPQTQRDSENAVSIVNVKHQETQKGNISNTKVVPAQNDGSNAGNIANPRSLLAQNGIANADTIDNERSVMLTRISKEKDNKKSQKTNKELKCHEVENEMLNCPGRTALHKIITLNQSKSKYENAESDNDDDDDVDEIVIGHYEQNIPPSLTENNIMSILDETFHEDDFLEKNTQQTAIKGKYEISEDILMMQALTIQGTAKELTERIDQSYGVFKSHWSPDEEDKPFWKEFTNHVNNDQEMLILNEEPVPKSLSKEKICMKDCYFDHGKKLHLRSPETAAILNK